jgi:hypothetical protein
MIVGRIQGGTLLNNTIGKFIFAFAFASPIASISAGVSAR